MVHPGLLLSALASAAAAAAYVSVAGVLREREPAGEGRVAADLFRMWWGGIAVYAFLAGTVMNGLAAFDVTPVRVFAAIRMVSVVVLCASLAGLTYYMTFVLTGRRPLLMIGLVFVLIYATVAYYFAGGIVTRVDVGAFETRLVVEPSPHPAERLVMLVALYLPAVASAVGFLAIATRLRERTPRFRAAFVSLSLFAWTTAALVAAILPTGSSLALARPLLGLVAAGAAVIAYAPPAWIRRVLRVEAWTPTGRPARAEKTT